LTDAYLESVAYGNSQFVAVGWQPFASTVLASRNGVTWTRRFLGPDNSYLRAITYGNGQFVAVGLLSFSEVDSGLIMTSSDGLAWLSESITNENFTGITYGTNQFVAVSEFGRILSTPDGTTWSTNLTTDALLTDIAYGNDRFIAVGVNGEVLASADGLTWTRVDSRENLTQRGERF
jgi:hypothetical protein